MWQALTQVTGATTNSGIGSSGAGKGGLPGWAIAVIVIAAMLLLALASECSFLLLLLLMLILVFVFFLLVLLPALHFGKPGALLLISIAKTQCKSWCGSVWCVIVPIEAV